MASTTIQRLALVAVPCAVAATLVSCGESQPTAEAPIPNARVLGEVGLAPGQFNYPRGIAAADGPDGPVLWTVDKSARIQRIDPNIGRADLVFQTPEHDAGKPCGLTIAPLPNRPDVQALYVADTHYHRVLVYDLSQDPPTIAHTFGAFGEEPGAFIYPTDVAVLLDDAGGVERIYVTEYGGNDRVSVFNADLEPVATFGALGLLTEPDVTDRDVVFNRPQAIAIRPGENDRAPELVIVDACNHRLGRFTLDGELIAWIAHASPARELGSVNYPYGLALLDDGTALVAEFGGSRVQRFDLDTGEPVAIYGAPGYGDGELASPWGVEVLRDTAYILDSGNNRVLAFDAPAGPAQPATRLSKREAAR